MGKSVHLRLPDDLTIALAERARVEGRTLAGLILHLLRGSLPPAPGVVASPPQDPPLMTMPERRALHDEAAQADPNELRYEKV